MRPQWVVPLLYSLSIVGRFVGSGPLRFRRHALHVRAGLCDAVVVDLITPDGASTSIASPALDALPNDVQFPALARDGHVPPLHANETIGGLRETAACRSIPTA